MLGLGKARHLTDQVEGLLGRAQGPLGKWSCFCNRSLTILLAFRPLLPVVLEVSSLGWGK